MTDELGNTNVEKYTNYDPAFKPNVPAELENPPVAVPAEGVKAVEGNITDAEGTAPEVRADPDSQVSTVTTGSFSQESTSSSSSTDENGNVKTSSNTNDFSGSLDSVENNINGVISGSKSIKAKKSDSSNAGLNGVNKSESSVLNATDDSSTDEDGKSNHEVHYSLASSK